jgi:dTDP-glucose 4,6-dehydratase
VNVDILDRCATINNVSDSSQRSNYLFVHGDITNLHLMDYVFRTNKIDTVMHFAAQSHVDNSFGNSLDFTNTNVVGTHVLLEVARRNNIKKFILVSTDEVYGDVFGEGVLEDAILNPTNPYSCSKAAAEFIAKAYERSYKLPIIITRGNNVYGPHQYPEKVIPKFIMRLRNGLKCCLHGDGSSHRSYVFVTDVAEAFIKILHEGKVGEMYNIGSSFEISMKELARRLAIEMGIQDATKPDEWIEYVEDRNINDKRYFINSTKLADLGWAQKVDFDEGLKKTIEWYNSVPEGYWEDMTTCLNAHSIPAGVRKPLV